MKPNLSNQPFPFYGKHIGTDPQRHKLQKPLGLVSHLDTVFPADEEERNNCPLGGKRATASTGPARVDIKGGTVLIYMMLDALCQHAAEQFEAINWVILVDASEEAEAEDFGRLCVERLEGPNILACLIFEGGSKVEDTYQIVVARKGMGIFRVETAGRASHAGSFHAGGANAIVQMAHTILKLTAGH